MWKTRFTEDTEHEHVVMLSRDDLSFVIRVIDWWIMSATRHLADKALKEKNLDFRASELDVNMSLVHGLPHRKPPVWTTDLVASEGRHEVHLLRDGAAVAVFSLEEFAGLSATKYALEEAVEEAEGLAVYGRNIKEAEECIEAEFADPEEFVDPDEDEIDDGPVRGPWESPRKR